MEPWSHAANRVPTTTVIHKAEVAHTAGVETVHLLGRKKPMLMGRLIGAGIGQQYDRMPSISTTVSDSCRIQAVHCLSLSSSLPKKLEGFASRHCRFMQPMRGWLYSFPQAPGHDSRLSSPT